MTVSELTDPTKQSYSDELNVRLCRLYAERHSGDLIPQHKVANQYPVVFDALVQPVSHRTVLMDIHRIFADEIAPFVAHARRLGYEGQFAYDGSTGRIQMDFASALQALRFKQAL